MDKKKFSNIISYAFLLIELYFFIMILFVKIAIGLHEVLVTGVAFAYSLFFILKEKSNKYTSIALLLTFIADFCLVVLNPRNQILAMFSFSIVQIMYAIKLYLSSDNKKTFFLVLRISFIAFSELLVLLLLKSRYNLLAFLAIFYFSNLITNMIISIFQFKKSPLFAVGLILFACCDILIGLQEANNIFISLNEDLFIYKLLFMYFNFAWLFYLPSQVLIALSTNKK